MIKLLCLLFITALEIFALEIPKGSSLDRRITSAPYDVNNVIRLNAKVGFVSVVEFAKEENIVNMATGFSEGWDLTAKGNLLFVTPKSLVTKVTEIETNEKGFCKKHFSMMRCHNGTHFLQLFHYNNQKL